MMSADLQTLPAIEALLEAIAVPAVLLDLEYRIRAANQAYRHTFGFTDGPEGRHCYEVSHGYRVPCDQAGESCPLKACLQSGQRQRILHIHNTRHGREHVDVELSPVRDAQGRVAFFIETMSLVQSRPRESAGEAMLGYSPAFNRMLDLLNRAASGMISVLLLGESGTGKELAARYLHEHSPRSHQPFVTLECSGLTETLFESELFGHEKGAFTGAVQRKPGLVEAARGGTLFLDEVGDIPLPMQVKLLRLLESGTYRPVGSVQPRQADFRLVCATHQPLAQRVAEGRFREDLFYRISAFPVHLPALRERDSDVLLIGRHLLQRMGPGRALRFSMEAEAWLRQQRFPGNVRELRNRIERAILLCDSGEIEPHHLRTGCELELGQANEARAFVETSSAKIRPLAEVEAAYLQAALRQFPGDRHELARALGLSDRTLYRKLQRLREDSGDVW